MNETLVQRWLAAALVTDVAVLRVRNDRIVLQVGREGVALTAPEAYELLACLAAYYGHEVHDRSDDPLPTRQVGPHD